MNTIINAFVSQDEGFINQDFIFDLDVLSYHTYPFYSDPLSNYTLPPNNAPPNKSMLLYMAITQNTALL
jgi:hypothetical protein